MTPDFAPLIPILLIPFAIAGLALMNTGLGRSRSAAHAMTSALCVICAAFIVYLVFGFAVQGRAALGYSDVGFSGIFGIGISWDSTSAMVFLLGMFSVGFAALIPIGAAADRWRLGTACVSAMLFAGIVYPIFAGFESSVFGRLGAAGILDVGGSGRIHATGGLTALAISWLLAPRRGKYSPNGMPAAIPAHSGVLVVFGALLAWIGWLGLNCAPGQLPTALKPTLPALTLVNTTLCAAAAALTSAAVTRIKYRRPDASLIANGWIVGLVASSAGCATLKPATALLTGLVAGALVVFSVEFFEFTLKVDDPCGSVSVHAVGGIWGLLAAGIFAGDATQFFAQLVAIATLIGFIFPLSYGSNWLLGRFIPHRVSLDGERQGLDLHEFGADAYPEFVVHADEFMQR